MSKKTISIVFAVCSLFTCSCNINYGKLLVEHMFSGLENDKKNHNYRPDPRIDGWGFRAIIDTAEVFAYHPWIHTFGIDYTVSEDGLHYRLDVLGLESLVDKKNGKPFIRDTIGLNSLHINIESDGNEICLGDHFTFSEDNKSPYHYLRLSHSYDSSYGTGTADIIKLDEKNCTITIDASFNLADGTTISLTEGLLICPYVYKGTY